MGFPIKLIRDDGFIHDVTLLHCTIDDGETVGEFRAKDFAVGKLDENIDFETMKYKAPEIVDVKYNDPATIVFWSDKTKTVAKCSGGDTYNPEMGLMVCVAKKYFGNYEKFRENFEKWSTKAPEPKYYNGRVVCVEKYPHKAYTVGKIYNVYDGKMLIDNGTYQPSLRRAESFEDLTNLLHSKFIEIKE